MHFSSLYTNLHLSSRQKEKKLCFLEKKYLALNSEGKNKIKGKTLAWKNAQNEMVNLVHL